ncbi:MAG: hypothetical protein LC114_06650 [Bryobacterales bacterium]|nr:hypothetical protein [Bryobacterales bacterium]
MPSVKRPRVLAAVYEETSRLLAKREVPTEHIEPSRRLYRAADLRYMNVNARGIFPRTMANQALVVRDAASDSNRFSGISKNAAIGNRGAIYCAGQQTALVNELMHYTSNQPGVMMNPSTNMPVPSFSFAGKFVVKIRLMHVLALCDLSPHNPGSRQFLDKIFDAPAVQAALTEGGYRPISALLELNDGEDCSMARGIGLAVAHCGWLHGLQARTVRPSDRSLEETGDNVVLFGEANQPVSGLWIESAYRFPLSGPPVEIPVQF